MKAEEEMGKKSDEGKQGWFAMPLVVLQPLLEVFAAGEGHYGLHNCLKPFDDPSRRFYDAQMRHVSDCQLEPMAIDPQDGCYHEAKVAFNALMRLYHCRQVSGQGPSGCANIPPITTKNHYMDPLEMILFRQPPVPGSATQDIAQQVEDLGFHVGSRRADLKEE